MHPVVFDGMAGWLHRPPLHLDSKVGILLCAPLGRDARCTHRPMRVWADRLAAAGYPTLRYDHPGTGDSLDLPEGADATRYWIDAVRPAVEFLKARTGVTGVVLGGVRMGATLAAVAAQNPEFEGVEGLMLLGPITAGRSWLRELRLTAAVTAQVSPQDIDTEGMQADGLHLTGPMVRSISDLDIRALSWAPKRILLLHQNENAKGGVFALEGLGAAVEVDRFEGYSDLFIDAHSNHPPEVSFDRCAAWLSANFPVETLEKPRRAPAALKAAVIKPPGARESAVTFGAGLWGVHCEPLEPEARGRAVIFLNSGGDPRFGIGRFSVDAGRVLARKGIGSLRFDFAGLGDSADPPDNAPRHIYETPRWDDMAAAVSYVLAAGYKEILVMGICAGAHHALHVALTDNRVKDALLVSPVKMLWRPGDSLDFNVRDDGRSTQAYMSDVWKLKTWRRLMTGDIDTRTIAKTLLNRLRERAEIRRGDATAELHDQIKALSTRGGRLTMLMGVDDAALDEVEAYFGTRGAKLLENPGTSVIVVPGLDHGMALASSRVTGMKTLMEMLGLAQEEPQAQPARALVTEG